MQLMLVYVSSAFSQCVLITFLKHIKNVCKPIQLTGISEKKIGVSSELNILFVESLDELNI